MPPLTADQAMEWLRTNHIAPDPEADPRAHMNAELDKNARMFAAVFMGHEGQAVLQLILEASLFRPPVDQRLRGGEYRRYAQVREGQNQLAATILAYIDHAHTLKGTSHEQQRVTGGHDPEPRHGPISGGGGDGPGDDSAGDDAGSFLAVR
jgi:hypothetical protein